MICRLEKIHQWGVRTHHSLLQHLIPIHREPARWLLSEQQSGVGQKIPFAVRYEAWTDDKRRQSRQWALGTSKTSTQDRVHVYQKANCAFEKSISHH